MDTKERDQYIWKLLKAIKSKYIDVDEVVELNPPDWIFSIPDAKYLSKLLNRLKKEGILTFDVPRPILGYLYDPPSTFFIKIIDEQKFDEYFQHYEKLFGKVGLNNDDEKDVIGKKLGIEIFYDKNTGRGYVKGKPFTFKNDQPEYLVFDRMYSNINYPISKEEILELCQYNEDKPRISEHKSEHYASGTYLINNLAKKMRKRIGLTPDQIVLNNGSLTLVGKKLKRPKK